MLVPVGPAEDLPCVAAEEAEDLDFSLLAFLAFFLVFGFASVVASVLLAAEPEAADGVEEVPPVVPLALGPVVEEPEVAPVVSGVVPEVLPPVALCVVDALGPVPVAPVLSVPVVDEPYAPVPLVPDAPDVAPLLPAEPVSLLLDCAKAIEDTDATRTKDSDRRMFFSVMNSSLNEIKGIIDAAAWM